MYQCDLQATMKFFRGEYSYSLSSDDISDPELPLIKAKAKGGTMILWRKHLDKFVTPCLNLASPSFLPFVLSYPGLPTSIHVSIYLPTSGHDIAFTEEVIKLDNALQTLCEKHPEALIYIRGDANVNRKNTIRKIIFSKFSQDWNLEETEILHPTYHHFVGDGLFDSQLDVLLFPKSSISKEKLIKIHCKHDNPLITSHHDALLSTFRLPEVEHPPSIQNPSAPRVDNHRVKIHWSDNGIETYKLSIAENLSRMRSNWLDTSSNASISVLLQSTNAFLSKCSKETNEFSELNEIREEKSSKKPYFIIKSERKLLKIYKNWKKASAADVSPHFLARATKAHKEAKRLHRKLLRHFETKEKIERDKNLSDILCKNPSKIFKRIRASKNSKATKVNKMKVGDMVFHDDMVPDGIFESIRRLKTSNKTTNEDEDSLPSSYEDYKNILDLCKSGNKIPPIDKEKSLKILKNIRKNVNDYYSITALHYLNAGASGHDHFHFLLNAVISEINLASLPELNTIYAHVLYKGHNKDKTSDRAYRTISTCPLISKAADLYVRELSKDDWNLKQADTQFQGEGSSHELAALLLTETIQHSLHTSKLPVYALFLDAKSAFDRVLKEHLVRNLFFAGTDGHRLLYLDQRLKNRQTYCEYDHQLMGPILDDLGLEQGGVSSSDAYKLYNNEQLEVSQHSGFGVLVRGITVSSIGLADDVVLVSNNIILLQHLLHLTIQYCNKYKVELVPEKTKLLVFSNDLNSVDVKYSKLISSISLYDQKIEFTEEAEHVGIIRSSFGNMPNILERISAHSKALRDVLPAGLALHHHGNPAAGLRVEQMYAFPKLLSGLSALVLTKFEVDLISAHYKNTLQRIMKLHEKTPDPVVYFLAGSLPCKALLHLRQLSLFGMICRLEENILKSLAMKVLIEAKPSAKSWFQQIREICILYNLPHPLKLLECPPTKLSFKKQCKLKVHEYWHSHLVQEAAPLLSLQYFQPNFLSLTSAHPLWTSLNGNPYQTEAAKIQAVFLSGRYRSERLCRFWSQNKDGFCLQESCNGQGIIEDINHIIITCDSLAETRRRLFKFTAMFVANKPILIPLIKAYLCSTENLLIQFMLDCSVLPLVISAFQKHGQTVHEHLFHISRTWCRSLHRDRLKMLGRRLF